MVNTRQQTATMEELSKFLADWKKEQEERLDKIFKQQEEQRQKEKKEEEQRRMKEKKEEEQRRMKEKKEKEERRLKEKKDEDERRQKEISNIFQNIRHEMGTVKEEIYQKIGAVQEQVGTVQEDFGSVRGEIREVRGEVGRVREDFEKKYKRLEREVNKFREETSHDVSSKLDISATSAVQRELKPPTFDGETSWTMYKRQFEAAANANGWSDQQRATALVLALRGKALEILQNIPEVKQSDYATVAGALELRYGNQYLSQVYQSQLKSRIQGPAETLQEFSSSIESMVRLAYPQAPDAFIEQISVQYFVDGIRDIEMQQALRLSRHNTLAETVVHALEYEAAKNASMSRRRQMIRKVGFEEESQNNSNILKELAAMFQDLQGTIQKCCLQGNRDRKAINCYNCGKEGHISRNCRRRSRSEDRRSPREEGPRQQENATSPV